MISEAAIQNPFGHFGQTTRRHPSVPIRKIRTTIIRPVPEMHDGVFVAHFVGRLCRPSRSNAAPFDKVFDEVSDKVFPEHPPGTGSRPKPSPRTSAFFPPDARCSRRGGTGCACGPDCGTGGGLSLIHI